MKENYEIIFNVTVVAKNIYSILWSFK